MNNENQKVCSTSDFDVFFLTYDEPNAEENWSDLVAKVPWARRIHGVKGFDNAHKCAADASQTDNFITIDGDNKIDQSFFDQEIAYNPGWIYSWGCRNHINHLIYGNGGIKLWPRQIVLDMKTHENTDDEEAIEFCWKLPYYQMNDWYSISYNNATAFQAFRVGFREGVKLSLREGKRANSLVKEVWHENLKRLKIWMTVGADIDNGIYAIYGARLGCYLTNLTSFDLSLIADYDWFKEEWQKTWLPIVEDEERFREEYNKLLYEVRTNIGLEIANLGKNQSKFFKSTLENPARQGLMIPEKDAKKYVIKNNFTEKNI